MNRQPQLKQVALSVSLSVGTLLTMLAGFSNLAVAQFSNPSNPDNYQTNERDANTGGTFGNSFNPLDLIHNANFRRSRDASAFQEDSQNNINQAAEDFKRMQREQLQDSNAPAPTTPSN